MTLFSQILQILTQLAQLQELLQFVSAILLALGITV